MRLTVVFPVATAALAISLLVGTTIAQEQPGSMMGMQHGQNMGHLAGSTSPAVEGYRAAMDQMMLDMGRFPTGDPDVDFAQGMIAHHQGAIAMAKIELQYGQDPELQKLAQGIVKAQDSEIAVMKAWLAKKGM